MKTVYRVLAYLVAAEVVVQAMAMVFAIAGLGKWVDGGGVFDKAVTESDDSPFPEAVGFDIHFINGMMIVPAIALLLLISSFFAKIPGAVKWAALVLLLVVVQVMLGFAGFGIPALGALHGLNALLLFSSAIYTARRRRTVAASPAAEPDMRLTTPV
jgi:heme A synthase